MEVSGFFEEFPQFLKAIKKIVWIPNF